MTWKHHRIVTALMVYGLTGSIPAFMVAAAGSTLPDALEVPHEERKRFFGIPYGEGRRATVFSHRGLSHYLPPYLLALVICAILARVGGFTGVCFHLLFYFAFGSVLHLLQDSLSKGGIQFFTPQGKRYGAGLYVLGTMSESIVVAVLCLLFAVIGYVRGYYSVDHAIQDVTGFILFLGGILR